MANNRKASRLVRQLGSQDSAKRIQAAGALLELGAGSAPVLIEALQSRDRNLPPLAAQILIRMGPTATPALTESLRGDHPRLRGLAADVLAQTKDPRAVPVLLEALHSEYYTVRAKAARALGIIASPDTLQPLVDTLNDPEPEVRTAALLAVGRFREPKTFDRMADLLLEDPEIKVRQSAAEALGDTRHPQAVPYLILALRDSFWWYEREEAADVLLNAIKTIGEPAVEPLIAALKDPEGTVRRFAAIVLGDIGDVRAVGPLGVAIYDLHFEVGHAASESLARFGDAGLKILTEALHHPEAWLRQHAISGLVLGGDTRIIPVLLDMLEDPDRDVVKLVIKSLGESGDERALPALQKIAADRSDRELFKLARQAIENMQ